MSHHARLSNDRRDRSRGSKPSQARPPPSSAFPGRCARGTRDMLLGSATPPMHTATCLCATSTATQNGALTQLQCGHLVRGHHGVPGLAVGAVDDAEWAAALDGLALVGDGGV